MSGSADHRLRNTHQVEDGQGEVACVGAEETSRTNVPSNGSCDDSECTPGHLNLRLGCELGNEEEEKGEVEEEEEQDEAERASERGDELQEGRQCKSCERLVVCKPVHAVHAP